MVSAANRNHKANSGVGLAMAIFIGELAFASEALIAQTKVAILVASLASGIFGYLVLQRVLPKS